MAENLLNILNMDSSVDKNRIDNLPQRSILEGISPPPSIDGI